MRSLTSRRRHKAVRPLLMLLALLVTGTLYSLAAPAQQSSADTSLVATGKGLFTESCASCHGLGGEGTSAGPAITDVGALAVDFEVSTGRMPKAGPAIQSAPKVNLFTQAETDALAAYVASLGTGPAVPTKAQYDPAGLTEEQIARGGELFRTNCSACHNYQGSGGALPNGAVAPSLLDASAKHIYEAMRIGPNQMPVFNEATMPDTDIRSIAGYLQELHAQPAGGVTFGGVGPVAEGFFAWVIGIGALTLFAVWIAARGARAR